MITNKNPVVAVFESHDQVENAIRQLQNDGFDLTELSIVGKDHFPEEHVAGYFTAAGNRMLDWGKLVACWGSFWVPGVGRLFVAGPFVLWITDALQQQAAVGRASALDVALSSIGIPKNSVIQYEAKVKNGKLLLVLHGTDDEVEHAKDLLDQTQAKTTTVYAEQVAVGV